MPLHPDPSTFPSCCPEKTGVGEWCAPGPASQQRQKWLLVFDDTDRPPVSMDDEEVARALFSRAEAGGWNCYLFQLAPRAAA